MRQTPAERVVEFLSLSTNVFPVVRFRKLTKREWDRLLLWMDDAGLAFYFLRKLEDTNQATAIPPWVTDCLQEKFVSNRQRVAEMSLRFDVLNRAFNNAGVRYVVLKGFSLAPQFCPDPVLRYQGDFDYLVDEKSLPRAQKVLVDAGYEARSSPSSLEFIYASPGRKPSRNRSAYAPDAPHAVELHLDAWDSTTHEVRIADRFFSVERKRMQCWNGLTFPALDEEDAFLLQVFHSCRHIFTYWIRTSSLLEIGLFLRQKSPDREFWSHIEQRVGENPVLREMVVVVAELVSRVFGAPLPDLIRAWGSRLRRPSRVWMDAYARQWAFCELPVYQFSIFPASKLVLFLHRQYRDEATVKPSRIAMVASSARANPSLLLRARWWKQQLPFRRCIFHVLANVRYVCEIPRWRWLNRSSLRSAPLDA